MVDITKIFSGDIRDKWENTIVAWEVEKPFDVEDNSVWAERLQKAFSRSLRDAVVDEETVAFWRSALGGKVREREEELMENPPDGCWFSSIKYAMTIVIAVSLLAGSAMIFKVDPFLDSGLLPRVLVFVILGVSYGIASVVVKVARSVIASRKHNPRNETEVQK